MAGRKKKKKSSKLSFVLSAIIAFSLAILLMVVFGDRLFTSGSKLIPPVPSKTVTIKKTGSREINAFFSASGGKRLKSQKMIIKKSNLAAELTDTLNILLSGPGDKKNNLESAVPRGTKLLSVRIKDKIAFVDLSSEFKKNHPGGSSAEMQSIYSIVNTVTMNFSGKVDYAQILINGEKTDTLAGHIFIGTPLSSDKEMVAD